MKNEIYYVASILAEKREKILTDALNRYFQNGVWDEKSIAEHMSVTVKPDGAETFYIHNVSAVEFGPIKNNITVDNGSVFCTFHQEMKVLI